ncbi:ATP-dependent zinc metalloprotease FtsH [Campylobacter majalis]|uniref:ATP-dependent zinc metalloprotease FtsH n=1 Tax=Campylobacter majalis TaxID=2790656 RepID=A0ABM8Q772_9BACT|nr:ATP-binding protein [Campylobacter majalis]CAD7288729.1 ATP-dependent zinc metalloprotease FtsH [Campylobacter majalis]
MQYLLEFLNAKTENSQVETIINANENEIKILKHLAKSYVQGVGLLSVFETLSFVFGTENNNHLNYLADLKSLIDNGWVVQGIGLFKPENKPNHATLLSLLHTEISLSPSFLKILEDGNLDMHLPEISAYDDHLGYLKDQFLRVELYEKNSLFLSQSEANKRVKSQITRLENHIKSRLELSKIYISVEQIFKEHALNEKEQLIFLTLLRLEYINDFENSRELNSLIGLVSDDEFDRMKNKTLLDDSSKLVESGLIEYDEIYSAFSTISKNFFINEEILQSIMHPNNSKNDKKIKLENVVKEQEIFELIEPTTSIDDVVLNEKTKELLNTILRQVDKKVLSRLNSWGIKNRKGIDAKVIFYGEAGTGKTMSAVSLAKSLKKQVLSFDCSKILSKYVGESEQNVRKIFDSYKDICKRTKSEPVLLLNEADQFLSTRIGGGGSVDKMHNQMQNIFLEQIERFEGVLIATTNFLESLDSAFSRRFDYKIEFKKPDYKSRLAIWRKVLPENADFEDGFSVEKLAEHNLSGAQIVLVMKNTALKVAVKDDAIFCMDDFKVSIERELSSAFGDEKRVGLLR